MGGGWGLYTRRVSTSAVTAAAAWKIKQGEMLRAQNGRSIPREPLEQMPPSTAQIQSAMMGAATKSFVSKDDNSTIDSTDNNFRPLAPDMAQTSNDRALGAASSGTSKTNTIDIWAEHLCWEGLSCVQ